MPIVLKSGSLNLLEPSGPVEACNGIALPLPLLLPYKQKAFRLSYHLGVPSRRSGITSSDEFVAEIDAGQVSGLDERRHESSSISARAV